MMSKEVLRGFFVGIIAPIAAFVVYVAFFTDNPDPIVMYQYVKELGKLSHVISLSLLINLIVFFMNIKTYRERQAKGILSATIFYGIIIVSIKFF